MKHSPILFSGAMVRSILAGRKTQTRRVVKEDAPYRFVDESLRSNRTWLIVMDEYGDYYDADCPYGSPGDKLWVRETWKRGVATYDDRAVYCCQYQATPGVPEESDLEVREADWEDRWRPSIHMPRWASRITLEIVSVRVERLQEISVDDAIAEGISGVEFCPTGEHEACRFEPVWHYMNLWNSINAKRGYGWDKNPWVWVIEFRMAE